MRNSSKTDLRVTRSKRDLANAFEELLKTKSFDDIYISEIADRAMISKNTFYNNFLDKADLLNFILCKRTEEIIDQLNPILRDYSLSKKDAFHRCIACIVHYFHENSEFFQKMIDNDRSKSIYWILSNFIRNISSDILKIYQQFINISVPEYVSSFFYGGAISNLLYFLFLNHKDIKEDDLVSYICQMMLLH